VNIDIGLRKRGCLNQIHLKCTTSFKLFLKSCGCCRATSQWWMWHQRPQFS